MKLSSRSKSRSTITIALLAATVSLTGLAGAGCTDSSGGKGTGGGGARAVGGQGGAAGAGQAGGAAGGSAGNGAGGGGAGNGGAAGHAGTPVGACVSVAPPTSGVDPTTRVDALTVAQQAAICDWVASRYCGYDKHFVCGDGSTVDSFPNQAYCITNETFTSCAATVADLEACERDATCENPFPDSCIPISSCPS